LSVTAAQWRQVFERVESRAKTLTPRRVLLAIITAPFFVLGWLTAWIIGAVWLCLAWAISAVQLGWIDAREVGARRRARKQLKDMYGGGR